MIEHSIQQALRSARRYRPKIKVANDALIRIREIQKGRVIIRTLSELRELLRRFRTSSFVIIDIETTGLNPSYDRIVAIALMGEIGPVYVIPVQHPLCRTVFQLPEVGRIIAQLVNHRTVVAHNILFESVFLESLGVHLMNHRVFDTMIAWKLLHNGSKGAGLKEIGEDLIGLPDWSSPEIAHLHMQPFSQVADYCALDVAVTRAVYDYVAPLVLQKCPIPLRIELDALPALHGIASRGVLVDVAYRNDLKTRLLKGAQALDKQIDRRLKRSHSKFVAWTLKGSPFNVSSTQQLRALLFGELKLPVPTTLTEAGNPAVDRVELENLLGVDTSGLVKLILRRKVIATLLKSCNPELDAENRLHTQVSPTAQLTGRISLKGFPPRNLENGKLSLTNITRSLQDEIKLLGDTLNPDDGIRRMILPEPGCVIVLVDFSQEEFAIVAVLSNEQAAVEQLKQGLVIHNELVTMLFSARLENGEAFEDLRSEAKDILFGILYGKGVRKLAEDLNCSIREAQSYMDGFRARFPAIFNYLRTEGQRMVNQNGFITNVLGRSLFTSSATSGANFRVQSVGAEIIKIGLKLSADLIKQRFKGASIMFSVHDEIVFSVPEADKDRFIAAVRRTLTSELCAKFEKYAAEAGNPLRTDLVLNVKVSEGRSFGETTVLVRSVGES